MEDEIQAMEWHGCYDESWKDFIAPESFAHPAKFANGLICRIIEHGISQGYWREGDTLGDPFGGVALGGIIAGYYGLSWVGVELEERFCRMAAGYDCPGLSKTEWVRWYNRFGRNPDICPHCQVTAQTWYEERRRATGLFLDGGVGVIPSLAPHRYVGNLDLHRPKWAAKGYVVDVRLVQGDSREFAAILQRLAIIDGLQAGKELSEIVGRAGGVVTSPPFIDPNGGKRHNLEESVAGKIPDIGLKNANDYGSTPGQIGRLPAGKLEACVTSPLYAESLNSGGPVGESAKRARAGRKQVETHYSLDPTPGNIGNLKSGELSACITSPPYAESIKGDHFERETAAETTAKRNTAGGSLGQSQRHGGYGASAGNIGNLREGSLAGAVTSPPYDENTKHDHTHDQRDDRRGYRQGRGCHRGSENYGQTPGQIGNLSGGSVEAVVTSPPFERTGTLDHEGQTGKLTRTLSGGGTKFLAAEYGQSDGQIGNTTSETYWEACRTVYEQVLLALKPQGVMACVVKSYVKGGKIVDLPGDTLKLLVALGFEPLEEIHAMLVKESTENTLFEGEVTKTKSRKSFFRRLCEAKGAPKIDYEEVLFLRKPLFATETKVNP